MKKYSTILNDIDVYYHKKSNTSLLVHFEQKSINGLNEYSVILPQGIEGYIIGFKGDMIYLLDCFARSNVNLMN